MSIELKLRDKVAVVTGAGGGVSSFVILWCLSLGSKVYVSSSSTEKIHNAKKLGVVLNENAKLEIARRSRGTPRISNRILRRVRDYALVKDHDSVQLDDVDKALELLDIDSMGLDSMDRKILKVINEYYNNGPVGIDALSATLGEDKQTIEEVYEPFLLKEGLLLRTPRGRTLSKKAVFNSL